MKELEILLHNIQTKLAVPKNRKNTFGNYNFRNAEDIIDAVKKLLPSGAIIGSSDTVKMIGGRYYIRAKATLSYQEQEVSAFGWAREPEEVKGMTGGQITGAASSYAKKYALCNLFAIDDGVDDDLTNNGKKETKVSTANEIKVLAGQIVADLKMIKTADQCRQFWDNKAEDVAKIQAGSTKTADYVTKEYGKRIAELTNA